MLNEALCNASPSFSPKKEPRLCCPHHDSQQEAALLPEKHHSTNNTPLRNLIFVLCIISDS
jgi:hypothetical protein